MLTPARRRSYHVPDILATPLTAVPWIARASPPDMGHRSGPGMSDRPDRSVLPDWPVGSALTGPARSRIVGRMMRARSHLLALPLCAVLVSTAGLHPAAMARGTPQSQVLTNQHHGCATTTCPKNVEVFGLIVRGPSPDPCGEEWLPPAPVFSSGWILPIPHVGRAPPFARV